MRALADEKIHEMVEVSSINTPDLNNAAVNGLHRVIRKKLYHGNYSQAERGYNWQRYLKTLGVYTGAKLHKIAVSRTMCTKELLQYQPYLDLKTKQEEASKHLFLMESA